MARASRSTVPLNRALSKLGILSRAEATEAIRAGRVSVNGKVVRQPLAPVVPERTDIRVDGVARARQAWRTILFHKPRGVLTTRRDPEGRATIYDLLGEAARGLIAVGRLDRATSGLLILTNDTQLANRLTDPANQLPRVYVVTVRGEVTREQCELLEIGVTSGGERVHAAAVTIRKSSSRESHLTVELREGRNREVRRLFEAIGHEVTRLKRMRFGPLELGSLAPGDWRPVAKLELASLEARHAKLEARHR